MCHSPSQYQQRRHGGREEAREQNLVANLIPKTEIIDSPAKNEYNLSDGTYLNVHFDGNATPNGGHEMSHHDHDVLPFFNETLELSQEDIQKTLSANMPLNATATTANDGTVTMVTDASAQNETILTDGHEDGGGNGVGNVVDTTTINSTLNPMDFIDNCCDDGNVAGVHEDDVFVNLDAFDMFVEFPELDLETKTALDHGRDGHIIDMVGDDVADSISNIQSSSNDSNENLVYEDIENHTSIIVKDQSAHFGQESVAQEHTDGSNELFNISDFSPEWAYPEGGIKVLVTGPWNINSNYTVLFDSFPVSTTIVQSGVLRCYCPAHEVGLAKLQVASDGYIISNSCIFEYKSPNQTEANASCDGTLNTANENVYKLSLFNRLESIDERMQIKMEPSDAVDDGNTDNDGRPDFEEHLVKYCQSLTSKQWRSPASDSPIQTLPLLKSERGNGMTLLHLAAALGYSRLVLAMLTWRTENPSVILETEIDALSRDGDGFTPLVSSTRSGSDRMEFIPGIFLHFPLDVVLCEGTYRNGCHFIQMELQCVECEKS